ncbi:magnesium-dependent phosphatase 1-like [Punica granatum]|uniref:Magnesium-dependent phosphatase 1-like n=1 Tax=Punica granatum TaxID=22663 RepID=A0A6P8CNF6_PUNGR|nr:magnesium-dependent phosphatase 1-like [Punica granatum]
MGEELEKVKKEAAQIIEDSQKLPRLVVFDLDCTFWPFYCECCYEDEMPYLYPHAMGILQALKDKGIDVAIASRSPTPDIAKTFLDKLGIQSMFVAQEIYSSWTHKTDHFQRIHRKTGVPFSSMLFFDDEDRNIQAITKMGVTSILVHRGVTLGALRQGLKKFAEKSSSSWT